MSLIPQYKQVLINFMSFRDNIQYENNHEFTPQELGSITPNQIVKWFCLKVYGNPNPDFDANPTLGRSSSLQYYKKSLSFFMPNKLMHWNELADPPSGNPTKSVEVNDIIKRVKKKEVRKQGKSSQARSAFEEHEFEKLISVVEKLSDVEKRLFLSGLLRFQYNMIARIDDSAKLQLGNLTSSCQYSSFTILAKLCWSKNVNEERDAPNQFLFGAMPPSYCVLLGLSTWLEYWISLGHGRDTPFAFGIKGINNPENIKNRASSLLKSILDDKDMDIIMEGKRGSHSIRKFATTRARRNDCSIDEIDYRGRWKSRRRQQDQYTDTLLQWPDARVCKALCKGGAIHYKIKEEYKISEDWILEYVVPHIATICDRSVSLVLGRALLWRCMDVSESIVVPEGIKARVRTAFTELAHRNHVSSEENPVVKVDMIVTGHDARVFIDFNEEEDDISQRNIAGTVRRIDHEQIRLTNSLLVGLRKDNQELRVELKRRHEIQEISNKKIIRSVNHIMMNPIRSLRNSNTTNNLTNTNNLGNRVGGTNEATTTRGEVEMNSALLSNNPKSLHTLWNEYEFGLGNNKAAKDFTSKERGKVKYLYHRRKVVWERVAEMVRSGYTAHDACNKIYEVYGANLSVTNIINLMRRDDKMWAP